MEELTKIDKHTLEINVPLEYFEETNNFFASVIVKIHCINMNFILNKRTPKIRPYPLKKSYKLINIQVSLFESLPFLSFQL